MWSLAHHSAIGNKDLPENADVSTTKCRSYRSIAQMCGVDLVACAGLPQPHVKSYMLHYEGSGSPHCVAVRVDGASKTATVLDGRSVYKMSICLLEEICAAAVDTGTPSGRVGWQVRCTARYGGWCCIRGVGIT